MSKYLPMSESDVPNLTPGDRYRTKFGDGWSKGREVRAIVDGDRLVVRYYRGRHYGWEYEVERVRNLEQYVARGMVQVKTGLGTPE